MLLAAAADAVGLTPSSFFSTPPTLSSEQMSSMREFRHYQFVWADGKGLERLVVNGLGVSLEDLPKVSLS